MAIPRIFMPEWASGHCRNIRLRPSAVSRQRSAFAVLRYPAAISRRKASWVPSFASGAMLRKSSTDTNPW